MFWSIGSPERLNSIGQEEIDIAEAKSKIEIAVLDDKPFEPKDSLVSHKFRIVELGPDIRSVDQVAAYSIIVCDVDGVAKAFGSPLQGAHLVSELRKSYPDKFLVAYTGLTYSLAITNALTDADKRLAKDEISDVWVETLEQGLNEIVNVRKRWLRLRRALLSRGVELFDVLLLEQAFIKSVQKRKPEYLSNKALSLGISAEAKDLVVKFAATAVATLISSALGI